MVRFCGQSAVVRKQVNRVIHESTGKMVVMKTPCVTLEQVIATESFSGVALSTSTSFGARFGSGKMGKTSSTQRTSVSGLRQ